MKRLLLRSVMAIAAVSGLFAIARAQTPQPLDFGAPYNDCGVCDECRENATWSVGADFLAIRPQFSQAVAFARGTQTFTSMHTVGEELDFEHDASVRAFAAYSPGDGDAAIVFTYWHLEGEVDVDGTAGAGEFIVDPFGNGVGTIIVLDPNSALFGQALPTGDAIATSASVRLNVFDLDAVLDLAWDEPRWAFQAIFGVRLADLDQHYESVITSGANLFSRGDFDAAFIGAGPRVGFGGRRYFGADRRVTLFANTSAAMLLGQYDEAFSSVTTVPGPFTAAQEFSMGRTILPWEIEFGADWLVTENLRLSAGWLIQTWLDCGASGGKFGGFFVGTDDANIMSFDGFVLRGQLDF